MLAYIELFQGRLHDFIEEGMKRGSKYLPMIQNVFRAEGLPLDLAYVPLVESAFKPNALSRTKAKGVWQFMGGTALENGLRRDWYIDERSDPEKATQAAAAYLQDAGNLFDGDWHLALASYNGGPGRLAARDEARRGFDDFWKLCAEAGAPAARNARIRADDSGGDRHREKPGAVRLRLRGRAAADLRTRHARRPVDLRRVAEWADTTIDEIQALNPELRRWTTPVKDDAVRAEGADGTPPSVVSARLAEAPAELASLKLVHRQARRDAAADRAEAERQPDRSGRSELPAGDGARDRRAAADGAARSHSLDGGVGRDRPVPAAEARRTVPLNADTLAEAHRAPNRVKVIYQVKQGDTLASIARLFKTTVAIDQNVESATSTRHRLLRTGSA